MSHNKPGIRNSFNLLWLITTWKPYHVHKYKMAAILFIQYKYLMTGYRNQYPFINPVKLLIPKSVNENICYIFNTFLDKIYHRVGPSHAITNGSSSEKPRITGESSSSEKIQIIHKCPTDSVIKVILG